MKKINNYTASLEKPSFCLDSPIPYQRKTRFLTCPVTKISLLFLFMGLFLLTACSSSDDVATAVQYINALEEGDVETATSLVCPERADTIMSGLMDVSPEERGNFVFENVSCAARGTDVACGYTIRQQTAEETPQEFNRNVVFEFEDGLICGFEEEVAP